MGILGTSAKILGNIATFGGMSRLEDAKASYENIARRIESLRRECDAYRTQIEACVKDVGVALKSVRPHIGKSEKILEQGLQTAPEVAFSVPKQTIVDLQNFSEGFDSALHIGKGAAAGGSLALGSWALVSTFGAASTGTAISTLSGVAATNATLAWFGGGAVAAGGAGVTGGLMVLGGIVAVPLVALAATGVHKKAKDIERECIELEVAASDHQQFLDTLPAALERVQRKREEIVSECEAFKADVTRLVKVIRPLGIFSVAWQWIRSVVGLPRYRTEQLEAIDDLACKVKGFMGLFPGAPAA